MAKSNQPKKKRIFEERKQAYMELFAREAQEIRDSIARDLPAYNAILSIHAESFEEIALRQLADKRGIPYDKNKPPIPDCPHCKSSHVRRKTENTFLCKECSKTFSANHNSISSGTKCSSLIWMKCLMSMLNGVSIKNTCEYCGITETTYYRLRNRIFYGMQVFLSDLKLYGNIEVDNCFVHVSYKGVDLQVYDYPEDSIFYDHSSKPRPGRKRGGAYSSQSKNANSICIFTGIDDHGHVTASYAGFGNANYRALRNYIPEGKFLLTVPEEDPFGNFMKPLASEAKTRPKDQSLMIADKEGAIRKYAESIGVQFESHVYRRDGVQRKLSPQSHNIQRINALHRRLKDYLRRANYVSTKYLPGFLTMFCFQENTGASQKAIERLFQILATPGLVPQGDSTMFFENLFSVPDYLVDWLALSDTPLKKIQPQKLRAFYLYDQIRNRESYPGSKIKMRDIEEETGFTDVSIRRFYNDLLKAGYRELIISHFAPPARTDNDDDKRPRELSSRPETFNPVILALYDEYAEERKKPSGQRRGLNAFLQEKNAQLGTSYKRANMLMKFAEIEKSGIRPPLPELQSKEEPRLPDKAFDMLADYDRIVLSYRERGEKPPKNFDIYQMLQEKYGLSTGRINQCIWLAKKALNGEN